MKKCPQCGRAYSDFVQQCPTCKIALANQQAVQRDPAVELGGGAGSNITNGAGQTAAQPPIQPPVQQSGSGTYPGGGTQGNISQNSVQNIPVTYANRHQFQPTPEEEFVICAHGGDCGIKKYVGNRAMVVIPAKIRGHRVVRIENQAFGGVLPTLRPQTVIIPETILEIGVGAFWRCRRLETVIAHPDIYLIGSQAFGECPRLKTVDFGVMQTRPPRGYQRSDLRSRKLPIWVCLRLEPGAAQIPADGSEESDSYLTCQKDACRLRPTQKGSAMLRLFLPSVFRT